MLKSFRITLVSDTRPLEVAFADHISKLEQGFEMHLDHLCDVCGVDTDDMYFEWMEEVSEHAYHGCPICRLIIGLLSTESESVDEVDGWHTHDLDCMCETCNIGNVPHNEHSYIDRQQTQPLLAIAC
jgi:uncharacterized protein (DUF169 family)